MARHWVLVLVVLLTGCKPEPESFQAGDTAEEDTPGTDTAQALDISGTDTADAVSEDTAEAVDTAAEDVPSDTGADDAEGDVAQSTYFCDERPIELPASISESLALYGHIFCQTLERCGHALLLGQGMTELSYDECVSAMQVRLAYFSDAQVSSFARGAQRLDLELWDGCVNNICEASCVDAVRQVLECSRVIEGTAEVGEACHHHLDCVEGAECAYADTCPGTCVYVSGCGGDGLNPTCSETEFCNLAGACQSRSDLDGPCFGGLDSTCLAALYCDRGDTNMCLARLGENEACLRDRMCGEGLFCNRTSQVCTEPVGVGEPCAAPEHCAAPLLCTGGPFVGEGECVEPAYNQGEGETCLPNYRECAWPNTCGRTVQGGWSCMLPKPAGELCLLDMECAGYCSAGNICSAIKAAGEPCSKAAECIFTCGGDGLCYDTRLEAGTPCADGSGCESELCWPTGSDGALECQPNCFPQ